MSYPKVALNKKYILISTSDHVDVLDGKDDYKKWMILTKILFCFLATDLWKEAKKIRKVPVQELIVDLHIENKGFAFSCYKSIFIYDFEKIDTSNSLFCGTMTKI